MATGPIKPTYADADAGVESKVVATNPPYAVAELFTLEKVRQATTASIINGDTGQLRS